VTATEAQAAAFDERYRAGPASRTDPALWTKNGRTADEADDAASIVTEAAASAPRSFDPTDERRLPNTADGENRYAGSLHVE